MKVLLFTRMRGGIFSIGEIFLYTIAQARRESKNIKNRFVITSNWTEKMPLSVKMGIKQLSFKIGQYVSLILLITIFFFYDINGYQSK